MSTPNKNTSLAVVPQQQNAPAQWEPENLAAGIELSKLISAGQLLPSSLRGKPADVLLVMMTGREFGLSPMQSIRSIHVIDGKGVVSADILVAFCKRRADVCRYFRMVESSGTVATYETHRVGEPSPTKMSFTLEEAKLAGLAGRGNWSKFPAAMLRARCSSALARAVYPDLCAGIYDPDELDAPAANNAAPASIPQGFIDAPGETVTAEPVVEAAPVAAPVADQAEATQEDKEKLMDQLADFGAAQTQAEVVAIKDAHKADWPDGHPLSAAFKEAFTAAYKRTKTSSPIPATA